MSPRIPFLAFAALAAFSPFTLRAAAEAAPAKQASTPLDTGSPAPAFKPTAWVQGEPVTAFEKGKTYLVECWATWCGPCVAQIPHLNALHKKYADKGLVIIGTNVWDKDEATAAGFVKEKGEAMSYRVAYDNKTDGQVTREWLKAAGVNGIPHAFVVKDGVIIWHGHPAYLDEATIGSMLAGTFDSAGAHAKQQAQAKVANESRAKFTAAQKAITDAIQAKDFDTAFAKVDDYAALVPAGSRATAVTMAKLRIHAAKGDAAGAVAAVQAALKANPDDGLLKVNALAGLLAVKEVVEDKANAKVLGELADSVAADPRFGKNASVLKLVSRARAAAGTTDAKAEAKE